MGKFANHFYTVVNLTTLSNEFGNIMLWVYHKNITNKVPSAYYDVNIPVVNFIMIFMLCFFIVVQIGQIAWSNSVALVGKFRQSE